MRKFQQNQQGFTAVELLITLFVAVAFLVAGYQLYFIVIKDNGQTRAQAKAANVAYNFLRNYSSAAANPCVASTPLSNSSQSVTGLSNVAVTVNITCPYAATSGTNAATNISRVEVVMTYNTPQQTLRYATYVHDTNAPGSSAPLGPTGLTLTPNSVSQISTSWTAPSGYTPTSYTLQYSLNSDYSNSTTIQNISGTSQTLTGLATSNTYYVRVYALSNQGVSQAVTAQANTYNNWTVYSLFATVADWNNDGKNDIVGYKPDGTLELHLGNGNGTFGPAIYLANIGTAVRNLVGLGKPTGASAPILFWVNNNTGPGYILKSNGGTGVTSAPSATVLTNWVSYDSVFAIPKFYTSGSYYTSGYTILIGKVSQLYIYTVAGDGTITSTGTNYGSGWSAAFPGDNVFGTGDWNGDGIGDIAGIDSSGNMTIYTGTGTGTTSSTFSGGSGWGGKIIGGYDYNGDGKPDMLRYTNSSIFYFYTGTQVVGTNGGFGPAPAVVN